VSQLRQFFDHRTLVPYKHEIFASSLRDKTFITTQIARLNQMINSAGRMWGDNVHYCMHLHLD
jgi:hypothetical protein